MNLNDLAKQITEEEGLKESLSIAQIKEVLRIVLIKIKYMPIEELGTLLRRIKS